MFVTLQTSLQKLTDSTEKPHIGAQVVALFKNERKVGLELCTMKMLVINISIQVAKTNRLYVDFCKKVPLGNMCVCDFSDVNMLF